MDTETGEMIVKRVSVPIGLEELMEGLVKEVLLKKPDDIYLFAARYFAQLLNIRDKSQTPQSKTKTLRSVQTLKDKSEKLTSFRTARLSKQFSIREDPSDTPIITQKPKMYHRNELKYKRRNTGPPITLEATRKDDIRKKYARSVSTEKHKPNIIESNNRNKRDKSDDSSKKTSSNNNKISNAANKLLVPAKTRVKGNGVTISNNSKNPLQDVHDNKKEDMSQKTSSGEGIKEDSTNNCMQFGKSMEKINKTSSIATDADVTSISPDEETKSGSNEVMSERSNDVEDNQEINKSSETMNNENQKASILSNDSYSNKTKSSLTDDRISEILISGISNDSTNCGEKEEVMESGAFEEDSEPKVLNNNNKETINHQNDVRVDVKEESDKVELSKHTVDVISDDSLELNDLEDDVFIKQVEIIDTSSMSSDVQKSNETESNTEDAKTISVEKDLDSKSAEFESDDKLKNVGDESVEISKAKEEFEGTVEKNSAENVHDLVNIIEKQVVDDKVQNTIQLECDSRDVTLNNNEELDLVSLNKIKPMDSGSEAVISQNKNENAEKLEFKNQQHSERNLKIGNIDGVLDSAESEIAEAILNANYGDTIKGKEVTNGTTSTDNDSALDANEKQNLNIIGDKTDQPINQLEPPDKTNHLIEVDLDQTAASTKMSEKMNENEPSHETIIVEERIIKKELPEQNENIDSKLASNISVEDEIKTVIDDINANSNVTESQVILKDTIKLENEILSPVSQTVIANKIEVTNKNEEDGKIEASQSIEKLDHFGENEKGTREATEVNNNKGDSNEFGGSSKNTSVSDTPKNETYTIDDSKNFKFRSISQNTSTDGLYVDEHISSGSSSARDDVIDVQVDNNLSGDINAAETPKSVVENNEKKILETVEATDLEITGDKTRTIVTMDKKDGSPCSNDCKVNDSVEIEIKQNNDNEQLIENKTKLPVEENVEEWLKVEKNTSNQDEGATNLTDEVEVVLDVKPEKKFSGKLETEHKSSEKQCLETNDDGDKDMSINITATINKEEDKTADGKSNDSNKTDLVDRVAKNYVNYIIDNDRIMQLHSNSSGEYLDNGDILDISNNTTSEVKNHIDTDKSANLQSMKDIEHEVETDNTLKNNLVKSESVVLDKSEARKEQVTNEKELEINEITAKTEIYNNTSSKMEADSEITQDIRKDQKVILETGNIERIDNIVKAVNLNSEQLNSNKKIPSFNSAQLREELEKVEQGSAENNNTVTRFEAEKTDNNNQVENITTNSSNTSSTTKPIKDYGEIEFTQDSQKHPVSKDLIDATLSISETGLIANQVKHFLNNFIKSEQQHVDKFDVDKRDIGKNGLIKTNGNGTNVQPSNGYKRAMSFDSSKLHEELRKVEEESKFSSFQSSYNPFLLHKEIDEAAKIKISDTSTQVDNKPCEESDSAELEKAIKAVLKIQSLWRGFKARKITKGVNYNNLPKTTVNETKNSNKNDDTVKIENKNFHSDSIELEKLLKAVLRIQATWRGFKARKKVKNTNKLNAGVNENKGKSTNQPEHSENDTVDNGKQFTSLSSDSAELKRIVASVVNIQAMWRGYQIRKNIKTKNHVNKKDELSGKINDPSVVKNSWRKKRETLTNQNVLLEVYAAIIIQKIWRGFKARRSLKENGNPTKENSDRKGPPTENVIDKTEVNTKETVENAHNKSMPEEKEDTVRAIIDNKSKKTYFSEDSSDSVKTVILNDAFPLYHSGNIDPFLDEILDYPIMEEETLLDDYQSKLLDKISGKEEETFDDLKSLEKIISPKGIDHISLDALKAEDLLHGSVLSKVDRDRKLTRSMGSKLEILEEEGSNIDEDKNETEKAELIAGTNISGKNNGGQYISDTKLNSDEYKDKDIVQKKQIDNEVEDGVSNKNVLDVNEKNGNSEGVEHVTEENANKAKADNTKQDESVKHVEMKNVECNNNVSNLTSSNLKSEQSVEFGMNGTRTKKYSLESSITKTTNKMGVTSETIKKYSEETIDDTTPNDIKELEDNNKEKDETKECKVNSDSLDIKTNFQTQENRIEANTNTDKIDQNSFGKNEGHLHYQKDDDKNSKDIIPSPIPIGTNGRENKDINEYIVKEYKSELKFSDLKSDLNAQDDTMESNVPNEQNNINNSPSNSNVESQNTNIQLHHGDTILSLCEGKDEKIVPAVGTDSTNKLKSEKSPDEKLYTFCSVPTPISANNKVNETSLPPDVELLPSTSDRSDKDGKKYRKSSPEVLKTGTLVIPLPIEVQKTLKGEQKGTNTIVEDLGKSTSLEGVSSVLSNAGVNSGELHDTVLVQVNNHQSIDIGSSQPIAVQLCQTSGQVYLIIILSLASDIQQDAENVTSQHPPSKLDVNDVSMDADVEQNNAQNPGKVDLQQPKAEDYRSADNSISQRETMESEKRRKIDRGRNMEAEAATKIQAGFRGYQVRKQLKLKNGSSDMNTRRSSSKSGADPTKSESENSSPDLEEQSAVKIQAGIRGFLVRRRQKKQSHQA